MIKYIFLWTSIMICGALFGFVISDGANDFSSSSFQCERMEFVGPRNFSANGKIVVLYNCESCKRCLQKLITFKSLLHRFTRTGYTDLWVGFLTATKDNSTRCTELRAKSGNISIMAFPDDENPFNSDSVFVFDKCSRLTYELNPPWVEYVIVKAAILSTWYDIPCGQCETSTTYHPMSTTTIEPTTTESVNNTNSSELLSTTLNNFYVSQLPHELESDEETRNSDASYLIPMRVIVPVEHIHRDPNKAVYIKYNYMALSTDDRTYHGHLMTDNNREVLYEQNDFFPTETGTDTPETTTFTTDVILTNSIGDRFKIVRTYSLYDDNGDLAETFDEIQHIQEFNTFQTKLQTPTRPDSTKPPSKSPTFTSLYQWIPFRLT